MWSQVLSGVHFLKDLVYLLPLCNEDTSPVTPALIISGCDRLDRDKVTIYQSL
ncbi:hypothetical protein HanRHA438_Chr17g0832431 [Helianthus annuus]|nr:hypothetical protein HanRHA438_Chr17g0832431 [Helianthus annuus]